MSSDFKEFDEFSSEWVQGHVQDREGMPWSRLAAEYRCSYLNYRTLRGVNRILDAGCGAGFLIRYLDGSRHGGSYLGLDRSMASLIAARRLFPRRPFLVGDLRALPFESNAFDLAYARDVLIHHPAPYDCVAELYRVAKYVLLRVRTAEIATLFTAYYRDKTALLHHFFPVEGLVDVAKALVPCPRIIRYNIHRWHPRLFDAGRFITHGEFGIYFVADVFIMKGAFRESPIQIFNDTSYSVFQRGFQRLFNRRSYLDADH